MPLCTDCRSEAMIVGQDSYRTDSNPPHGLAWGEGCDRCTNAAEVCFSADV